MRDDLLDAQASVDWAKSQVPLFAKRFEAWEGKRPYNVSIKRDSNTGDEFLEAVSIKPLDPIINAEAGAIINGIRTALDLLAASLAKRNRVCPSADTHFPIFASELDMIDPLTGIEGKKWLSRTEQATIKSLKPYKGGDPTLWSLHHLDIARKHYKLIGVSVRIADVFLFGRPPEMPRSRHRLDNQSVLYRLPPGRISASEGDAQLSLQPAFEEPAFGLPDHPVITTLRYFATRVTRIIKLFDH